MKRIFLILIIIFLFLSTLILTRDKLITPIVTVNAQKIAGLSAQIDRLTFGIAKKVIRINGFKLLNPCGYPEKILFDIPKITADYDMSDLLNRRLHFYKVSIEIKEVAVIKNKTGGLNIESLRVLKNKGEQVHSMQIDSLSLSIGRVVYKDYSKGTKPDIEVFESILPATTYEDISSAEELFALILVETFKGTTVKGAAIYGAADFLGVGFFPFGTGALLTGKDTEQAYFSASYDKAYKAGLDVLCQMGKIIKEDNVAGFIRVKTDKSDIVLKIVRISDRTVQIVVTARRFLIPQPQVAGGVLYRLKERLK